MGKIAIKPIEKTSNRRVTFSRRTRGLLKKANELSILCDAQVGMLVFSSSGKLFEYCSPSSSMKQIIERYQIRAGPSVQNFDDSDSHLQLQACMRRLSCEDFMNVNLDELVQTEDQLKNSLRKLHTRKLEMLEDQLQSLRLKEEALLEKNKELHGALLGHQSMERPEEAELIQLLPPPQPHALSGNDQPNLPEAIKGSDLRLSIG